MTWSFSFTAAADNMYGSDGRAGHSLNDPRPGQSAASGRTAAIWRCNA